MNLVELEDKLKQLNLPAFRLKQIRQAYFVDLAKDWNEVTTLSKDLREKLKAEIDFDNIKIEKILPSKDKKTFKASFALKGGLIIESVLMVYKDRVTVCVSSQVGCSLACQFCATGAGGFKRNLNSEEIYEQIILWNRFLKEKLEGSRHVTNLVFMGMGEPFLNWDNLMDAIKIINDKNALNIGQRHISISTAGIIPGIKKFTKLNSQINLAVSLNAPNDKLRSQLMPINKKFSLRELLRVCKDYVKKTNRKLFFEYILIKETNDSLKDAEELASLLKGEKLFHVNLIPYNVAGGEFKPSTKYQQERFYDFLIKNNIKCTIRRSFGKEVKAACGQLVRS